MTSIKEIQKQLETLSAESLAELAHFVEYLKWRERQAAQAAPGETWSFEFVESLPQASVRATKDPTGMEVKAGMAACDGDERPAILAHPPVDGEAVIEYHVPVPAGLKDLQLHLAMGIRDGSQIAEENLVAFRVRVNGWKLWSGLTNACRWEPHQIDMPALSGDVARVEFVTEALGEHRWTWAAWGRPVLVGKLDRSEQ